MKSIARYIGTLAFLLGAVGCAEVPESSEVARSESALVGQDTFLYFLSNSSGWQPSSINRFRGTVDPYVFSMLLDVKENWMVESGDNAVFKETDAKDAWGVVQTQYGTVNGNVLAPGGDYLKTGGGGFMVKYPSLGRYRVTANWKQGTFNVASATKGEAWQPCLNEQVTTIAQSPMATNHFLVGCSNGDIHLSFNGLSSRPSWLKVDTWNTSAGTYGLPDLPVNDIAVSPADIKTAYVAFAGSKQGHKLWKTTTGGATWIELSNVPFAEIWSISVNPRATENVYITGPSGVAQSSDYGATWSTSPVTAASLTTPFAAGSTLSTVTVAPGNPDLVWVGATNGDIFFTTNATSATQTWSQATHGMPTRLVTNITLDVMRSPTAPSVYATFAGLYNDSLWVTTNNGFGWANLHSPPLPTTNVPLPSVYAFYGISINPADTSVVYIDGTYGAGVSTSSGASFTWTSSN